MPHLTRLRAASAALAAGALTLGGLALAAPAQASTPRIAIAGTHPAWAADSQRVGRQAVTAGFVTARVYLAGNTAGLARFDTAVSTPGDALYRHFLTPAQLQARFGTTPAQLAAVKSWLRQSGLAVTSVSDHLAGGYVAVRGSVAAASRAFGVTFARYHAAGQGTVRAPMEPATAPSSVARSVLTVTGLSTARQVAKPMNVSTASTSAATASKLPPPPPNYWIARPCAAYYGQKIATSKPKAYGAHQPWAVCGYTPRQVRGAYGVTSSGMTGKGQTVAIVDAYASPTMLKDADTYARVVGDKPFASGQYKQYLPAAFTQAAASKCDAQGWYGEQTLDVESVHGMAPDANVRFVAAANCQDSALSDALAYIVNNHVASIVSNSWGDTEDGATGFVDVYHKIFQAGTAEGISFMFSSGDSGYESPAEDPASDKIQVDYPTSDPYVTSVGGTSLAIGAKDNYQFETSWGTVLDPLGKRGKEWQYTPPGQYPAFFDGAGGGGTSTLFAQPAYQAGVVPNSLSTRLPDGSISATPMREVPDVSAYADPATGFLVGETILEPNGKTYGFALSRIGGTSVACPTFAGIEADAQQAAGHPLGFANPLIYKADTTAGDKAFHDVKDHPLGPTPLAQVRANYTNAATKQGPILYYLRTLGIDGEGAAALHATVGYDDATGVGSPRDYINAAAAISG
ncbi:MAG: protease pro-enzyme activation domain-containing protein [Streptosporangiaceae bacterium]|jgi:subtilase family serine protease